MSDVAAPTAQLVAEINADIRNGETNRATAKIRLLEEKYVLFLNGGPRPEVFISDIREVDK